MTNNRRTFLKKACLSGACLCGFGSLWQAEAAIPGGEANPKDNLYQTWIADILNNLSEHPQLGDVELRSLVKSAGKAHYAYNRMDAVLEPYIGKPEEFMRFIEKEWDWVFSWEEEGKVLIADENKPFCVCPLLDHRKKEKLPAVCYCSEGFAEMMFSKVYGKPVQASIISSIQRGDEKCIYRICL